MGLLRLVGATVETYAPDGIRLALLLTGDGAFAEDLVQDAFARLVGRLRHLREPNAFLGVPAPDDREPRHESLPSPAVERAYERLAATPSSVTNVNDERDETMHRILLGLPKRQRAAIVLQFYGDMAVWFGELDDPQSEGQLLVRALNPELVWLAHEHEPWRPAPSKASPTDSLANQRSTSIHRGSARTWRCSAGTRFGRGTGGS